MADTHTHHTHVCTSYEDLPGQAWEIHTYSIHLYKCTADWWQWVPSSFRGLCLMVRVKEDLATDVKLTFLTRGLCPCFHLCRQKFMKHKQHSLITGQLQPVAWEQHAPRPGRGSPCPPGLQQGEQHLHPADQAALGLISIKHVLQKLLHTLLRFQCCEEGVWLQSLW